MKEAQMGVRSRIDGPQLGITALAAILRLCGAPVDAQPINSGLAYLSANQSADGGWRSAEVREALATTEAMQALQLPSGSPVSRAARVLRLESTPIEDTDDRARRIAVLAMEGGDVSGPIDQLRRDAARDGGWGLNSRYAADAFDTSLALAA